MNLRVLTASLLSAASAACVNAADFYVSPDGANVPPFNNWGDAATNVQNAVNAASAGDTVWVTNGTYATGGRAVYTTMTNRAVLDKPLTLQSVNGPLVTFLLGYSVPGTTNGPGAVRCAWLTNGAVLSGFTLTNGATLATGDTYQERSGGGAWCSARDAVVINCVLAGNSASYGGGGAYQGTLTTCTLAGNSAGFGGGAYSGTLNNCTLTVNTATNAGGGAYSSGLNNCILTRNSASYYGGGARSGGLTNCTLTGNSGEEGGGAYYVTLNNCTLIANTANDSGGGAYLSTLNNCILTRNSAYYYGGGARLGSLTNCTLTGNSAYSGGGAYSSTLSSCSLSTNTAKDAGGGAYSGTLIGCTLTANTAINSGGGACVAKLNNCVLTRNSANVGGGAWSNTLNNCTLSANTATDVGGGAYSATLTNCALVGNSAYEGGGACASTITSSLLASNSAAWGGGASLGTLTRCTLKGNTAYSGGGADSSTLITCLLVTNSAYLDGGGADLSTLLSCTLAGNYAGRYGGGASSSTVSNSIVMFNSALQDSNFCPGNLAKTMSYSCTTPIPTNGAGNIAYNPLFLDPATGNFRLQSNSPCINFGNNSSYSSGDSTDLDGRARPVGHIVDIGAYEFDPRVDPSFIAWLQYYGLPTDGSADYSDPDGDGLNNWQEWMAGTNPTNAPQAPRMLSAEPSGANIIVTWQSVSSAVYSLEYATNLTLRPAFQLLAANLPGHSGTTTFVHTNAAASTATFYRVRSP